MYDVFSRAFPTAPFREEAENERRVAVDRYLSRLQGQGPQLGPAASTGFRGADLARLGAAQGARAVEPAAVNMSARLAAWQRERQRIAEESTRKSRLLAEIDAAAGGAVRAGVTQGTALAYKGLAPLLDRGLSGIDNDEPGYFSGLKGRFS